MYIVQKQHRYTWDTEVWDNVASFDVYEDAEAFMWQQDFWMHKWRVA